MQGATASPASQNYGTAPRGSWADLQLEPRFEIGFDGKLLAANADGQAMLSDGAVSTLAGKLRLGAGPSNRALDQALLRLWDRQQPGSQRIVVRLMNGGWRACDLFADPALDRALLIVHGDGVSTSRNMGAIAEAFSLTACEADVLGLLSAGECPKEIARALDISEHTVRSHLRSVYGKLGVRGASNALRLALQLLS